jgi:hypothetical protein
MPADVAEYDALYHNAAGRNIGLMDHSRWLLINDGYLCKSLRQQELTVVLDSQARTSGFY